MMTAREQLEKLYAERGKRAGELHEKGKKVIGYFCCFVPDEIIAAFDMVPYRIQGSQSEPIDQADAYIETMACPFARSCFNLALKGRYDFLDGFVAPHSCDTIERMYHIWLHNKPSSFNHLINVPHMLGSDSTSFYRSELAYFIKSLEDWSGRKLEPDRLKDAVRLYNRRRALLRELYELRKTDPPQVSGTEVTKVLVAGMGIPAEEHIHLLEGYMKEIKARPVPKADKLPRIFIWGNEIDDTAFINLVEESGAQVVMDDLCTGTRFFWDHVPETKDPLDGIAARYLNIHCPRSNVPQMETRTKDLENRYGYIGQFVKDWSADGAIFYIVRYCDTCELEGPDLREYLNNMKIPVLMVEDDYSTSTIGQLRTRVQAFLEMLG
jgi:bzd-type benzoyl-CoA reductase N subunit